MNVTHGRNITAGRLVIKRSWRGNIAAIAGRHHAASLFKLEIAHMLLDGPTLLARMSQQAREFATSWSAPERARQLAVLYRLLTN